MHNAAYDYLRRAAHSVWRVIEIGLFTHTPCPSHVVTEAIIRDDRLLRDAEEARADDRMPAEVKDRRSA